jgi:hypothetical protein
MIKKLKELLKGISKPKSLNPPDHSEIQNEVNLYTETIHAYFEGVIKNEDADGVEEGLSAFSEFEKKDEFIYILHKLILAHWHHRHEDIIHELQRIKNPESIPFIKQAMQTKYDYLEAYGTGVRQFINQCGHALASIGNKEAIETIKELTLSATPVLKDEMLYRISRIEKRNNYERNYGLD